MKRQNYPKGRSDTISSPNGALDTLRQIGYPLPVLHLVWLLSLGVPQAAPQPLDVRDLEERRFDLKLADVLEAARSTDPQLKAAALRSLRFYRLPDPNPRPSSLPAPKVNLDPQPGRRELAAPIFLTNLDSEAEPEVFVDRDEGFVNEVLRLGLEGLESNDMAIRAAARGALANLFRQAEDRPLSEKIWLSTPRRFGLIPYLRDGGTAASEAIYVLSTSAPFTRNNKSEARADDEILAALTSQPRRLRGEDWARGAALLSPKNLDRLKESLLKEMPRGREKNLAIDFSDSDSLAARILATGEPALFKILREKVLPPEDPATVVGRAIPAYRIARLAPGTAARGYAHDVREAVRATLLRGDEATQNLTAALSMTQESFPELAQLMDEAALTILDSRAPDEIKARQFAALRVPCIYQVTGSNTHLNIERPLALQFSPAIGARVAREIVPLFLVHDRARYRAEMFSYAMLKTNDIRLANVSPETFSELDRQLRHLMTSSEVQSESFPHYLAARYLKAPGLPIPADAFVRDLDIKGETPNLKRRSLALEIYAVRLGDKEADDLLAATEATLPEETRYGLIFLHPTVGSEGLKILQSRLLQETTREKTLADLARAHLVSPELLPSVLNLDPSPSQRAALRSLLRAQGVRQAWAELKTRKLAEANDLSRYLVAVLDDETPFDHPLATDAAHLLGTETLSTPAQTAVLTYLKKHAERLGSAEDQALEEALEPFVKAQPDQRARVKVLIEKAGLKYYGELAKLYPTL